MKGAVAVVRSGWKIPVIGQLMLVRNFASLNIGKTLRMEKPLNKCSACSSLVFCNTNEWNSLSKTRNLFELNLTRQFASKVSNVTEEESVDGENPAQLDVYAPDPIVLTEEEILEKRNKSGLRPYHLRTLNDQVPHPTPTYWTHHTVRYKRRTYGIYGENSGISPGLMWPTQEDLESRLEYESVAYPFTFQQMVEKKKELRRLEKEEYERRAADVEKKMELVEKLKQDIFNRKAAKEKEVAAAKAKRELLMEEVRRHFGYTVDPRDEKFQELLDKKEKAQKKAMKEAKRLERQKMLMEKVTQSFSTETTVEPKKAAPPPPINEEALDDDDDKKKNKKQK